MTNDINKNLKLLVLELIFTVILNNITRTDGQTDKIPSPWAPVGAKNGCDSKDFTFRSIRVLLRKQGGYLISVIRVSFYFCTDSANIKQSLISKEGRNLHYT